MRRLGPKSRRSGLKLPTLNWDEKRASLGAIVTVNSLWILDDLSCSPADVAVLAFHRCRVGHLIASSLDENSELGPGISSPRVKVLFLLLDALRHVRKRYGRLRGTE